MEQIAISEFKAKCLAILDRVRKTGKPILVTRFGKPVVEVSPPTPSAESGDWIGSMASRAEIVGDIVAPIADEADWEVLRR